MSRNGAGTLRYLWEAFKFRWNALALAGGVAAGVLSGRPDIVLPLIAAGELAYLSGMVAIPKFRQAIDVKAYNEDKPQIDEGEKKQVRRALGDMLAGLQPELRHRFQRLRARCLDMQRIARGVRGGAGAKGSDHMRVPSLDRLLWAFVRLLYSQQALQRFLDTTDEAQIAGRIEELGGKLATANESGDERIMRSLTDSLATAEMRIDNYRKAEGNAEFVQIELDRIEDKVQAISEMAVSNQDPDYISSQVDSVAASIGDTEKAIRDLNYITGLGDELEEAPSMLDADLGAVLEG